MKEFEIKYKIARAIAEQQPTKDGINKSTENIYEILQEQLRLHSVGVTLPTKKETDIEVKQQLIDWGYNEHASKKVFERGFKSSFYWLKNKITEQGN